jgi:hypothetical protein
MKATTLTHLFVCSIIVLSGCAGEDSEKPPQQTINIPLVCTSDLATQSLSLLYGELPEVDEALDYEQALADYISAGWAPHSQDGLGLWVDEVIGTSLSEVDWTPYENAAATCSQDHTGSTDYLFKPLAPGYQYVLKATVVTRIPPENEITLLAYGSMQNTTENSEPIFLLKEFPGEISIDGHSVSYQFEVDSRYMTSINLKLTSGDEPILWNEFELGIAD